MKHISKKLLAFAMVLLTVLTVLTPVLPGLAAQAAKEVYVPGFPLPITEMEKVYKVNVLEKYTKEFAKKEGIDQTHRSGLLYDVIPQVNKALKKADKEYIAKQKKGCEFMADIEAVNGTNIYAVADGEVVWKRALPNGKGYEVAIYHEADNTYSYYCHMPKKSLDNIYKGKDVKAGDVIGKVGYGHLHFEWYKKDVYCMYKSWGLVKIDPGSGADVYPHKHKTPQLESFGVTTINPAKEMKTIKDKVAARTGPYEVMPKNPDFGNNGELPINTSVMVVGSFVNIYGNTWYKTSDGYWIYGERLSEVPRVTVTYKSTKSANKKDSKKTVKVPKAEVVAENEPYIIPTEIPEREGYKFMGWALTENANAVEFEPGQKIEAAKMKEILKGKTEFVLYPVWCQTVFTMQLNNQSVKLDLSDKSKTTATIKATCGGDLNIANQKLVCKSDNSAVATAESISQKTDGSLWNKKLLNDIKITAKGPGSANIAIQLVNDNGTVLISKSVYVTVDNSYNIKYHDANGSVAKTQTKKYNKDIEILDYVPEVQGKTFLGWAATSGATKAQYGIGDSYKENKDLNLYPVYDAKYGINYNFKDGILTVYGLGDMASYPTGKTPWASYATQTKEIRVETGVTSVGANAFANFTNLTKVTLAYGITRIGAKAFYNCKQLETIKLPANVTYGSRAFANCTKLVEVTSQTSKTRSVDEATIGAFAFENCVSLASIDIYDNVTEIGEGAFNGCSAIENIEIPDGVEVISDSTFFGCNSLEKIDIPEGITEIGEGAFSGCSAAEEITIPDTVDVIGDQAFSGCSVITEIEIPESVDTIGAGVFTNCSALTDVELPDNMEYLGSGMFSGCAALETVDIPDTVSYMGEGAFAYCSSLKDIELPENVTEINDSAFYGCSSLENLEIPENIVTVGDYAFGACENLADVTISEGTESIGIGAFAFCDSLETVSAPASLCNIDDGAFMDCASLETVDLLESELTIGEDAFYGCSSLENIQLPEGTVSIGDGAFDDCSEDFAVTCFSTSSVYEQIVETCKNVDVIYPVSGITLDKSEVELKAGQTLNLNAAIAPANATVKDIIWHSNNPDYVSVDENGKITAHDSGKVIITATTKDNAFTATCVVNSIVPVEGVSLGFNEAEVYIGEEFSNYYTFAPVNPSDIGVSWSSSDESIATVAEDGTIKILSEGEVTITITTDDGGYTDSCVLNAVEYIEATDIIMDKTMSLTVGESKKLQFEILPSDATSYGIVWYIEDEDIITIDEYAVVTALKAGTTEIYAYIDNVEAVCTVTVGNAYTFAIQSPSATTIRHKDGIKLHAKLDGTAPEGSYVRWSASNGNFRTEEINDGNSLKIVSAKNGNTTFTATLYDVDGNVLATQSIEMKSKAGLFDKILSFFRSIFGGVKMYEN